MEVSIRDTRDNSICAIGEQGEICCRGYNVMTGYNDNPGATAVSIDAEGWLHTGDLGRMDSRGYLRITGRVKDMIIRGGENLFPAEKDPEFLDYRRPFLHFGLLKSAERLRRLLVRRQNLLPEVS
jgi:fatty-acyl-CoA synthase